MHRRFWFCFSLFWFAWLVLLAVKLAGPSNASSMPEERPAISELAPQSDALVASHHTEDDSHQHVNELALMETRLQQREEAAARTESVRRQLQFDKHAFWEWILTTNRPAYLALKDKLRASTDGVVRCNICDGTGWSAFCILCDSTAKCPTCQGTGKGWPSGICPNCLGKGKCYLCSGGKRMPCPFCLCGIITRKLPPPPSRMPM